jgi:hypothetical protein
MPNIRSLNASDLTYLTTLDADDVLVVIDSSASDVDGRHWKKVYAAAVQRTTRDEYANTVTVEDGYWEDLRFPAQGINPAGSAAPPTVDDTTFPGTLLFSHSADNVIGGVAQLPHSWQRGTAIRPHVHWAKTTSATGTVAWRLRYTWADIGGTFGAYSDWDTATSGVPNSNTANKHALATFTPITPATGVGESSMICWQVIRDVSEDDYGASARLLEVDFHYQTNKNGTRNEIPS